MSGKSIGIPRCRSDLKIAESSTMAVHYLEIVSNDVQTLTGLYQRIHGLSFGPPDPDLGQARVATGGDGTLVGIRKPLVASPRGRRRRAAHEQPIMRTYLEVEDIQQAVKKAEEHGAVVAYPPTRQGQRGTFAIVIQGDAQHGLWQR
jgi:predicted enzyme related to lactoylglutathione lyase